MISMKKLGTFAAAAGLFASTAVPALAWEGPFSWNDDELSVRQKNSATVNNYVDAKANTGDNSITADYDDVERSKIHTGNATALADVYTEVNENKAEVEACECDFDSVKVKQRNSAYVNNYVDAKAKTGDNSIYADDDVERSHIHTGNAYATAVVTNLVNRNVARVN